MNSKYSVISNYFVEVHPGKVLNGIIEEKKNQLISFLGEVIVDNPFKSRFLRDSPHFTLMCARTGDLYAFSEKLEEVANNFSRISYEIVDVEDNRTPGDLIGQISFQSQPNCI